MKTRPVFESFKDFVHNLYEMELRNPGSIKSLMEGEIPSPLKSGNSYGLPDLLKVKGNLGDQGAFFQEAVQVLQVSASSDDKAGEKLKEFSTQVKELSNEEWIDQEDYAIFMDAILTEDREAEYKYGDSGNVEVKGAPKMDDMTTIEKGTQTMSYSQMIALVAAYNASIFIRDLAIQKENIKDEKSIKKVLKGKEKIFLQMPLSNPQDQLVITVTEGNSIIVVESVKNLSPEYVNEVTTPSGYPNGKLLTDSKIAQFKYVFPIIIKKGTGGEPLDISVREKIVAPDKSKSSQSVTDFPLQIEEQEKAKESFYVTNEADLTSSGKIAAVSLTRMFKKITKVVVEGSADQRTAGSPWKDNNELASARRDKMVEYLKELSADSNSPLSGATIEAGEVKVQPKDEATKDPKIMASWRAVKLKITGEIYDDTMTAFGEAAKKDEPKKVTYSEVKKGMKYTFTNCCLAFRYDYEELASDRKQFEDK